MIPIRLATTKDATEIASMSRDFIESGLGWSWNRPRVVSSIRDPDSTVAVSTVDELVSGFAIMVFREHTAHLNLLAVKPKYRREGVGKDLVRWLEESAKTAGTFELSLEVRETNLAALAFYQRLGYQQSGKIKGYYQRAESAIRMTRNISVLKPAGG
jgi:ribosomal-protein-alanine N-acetyltransferase